MTNPIANESSLFARQGALSPLGNSTMLAEALHEWRVGRMDTST
jgi:hypothetical protein